jgi:cytochrome o ubiquinol oxidase subunit 1
MVGVVFQIIQLRVSIRRRHSARDLSGDPWDGRTLEWASSSPPPVYNFAVIPQVHDIDAFTDMKEKGIAYQRPERYHNILMPKNAPHGVVIGALSFLFGFSAVWYIWWLAILSAVGLLITVVARSMDDDTEYTIPAAEVERIENQRHRQMSKVDDHEWFAEPLPFNPLLEAN